MKKLFILLQPLMFLFFLSACTSTKKLLVNTWKLDTLKLAKEMRENMQKDGRSDEDITAILLIIDNLMGKIITDIQADGTLSITTENYTEKGTWELDENILTIISNKSNEDLKLNIISISKKRLIIAPIEEKDIKQLNEGGIKSFPLVPVE